MLREEMQQVRRSRFQCQLAKVTAVGSLIGAGALLTKQSDTYMLFYIVPFVAVAFDLFALGESFTMRRMHTFVKKRSSGAEKQWQDYVAKHPNRYTAYGNLGITVLCALGCGVIIWQEKRDPGPLAVWAISLATAMLIIWRRHQQILKFPEPEDVTLVSTAEPNEPPNANIPDGS